MIQSESDERRRMLAILGQYESLKTQAKELLEKCWDIDASLTNASVSRFSASVRCSLRTRLEKIYGECSSLISTYNLTRTNDEKALGVSLIEIIDAKESSLRRLMVECDKVIRVLSSMQNSLPQEARGNLNDLRKEYLEISDSIDVDFEKNFEESLKEAEHSHFLASTLITSRIIDYLLREFKGETDEEKVENLVVLKIVDAKDKDSQQKIIKSSRLSRNFLNHRISTFAECSDALSLLGGCLLLLKLYSKIQIQKKEISSSQRKP